MCSIKLCPPDCPWVVQEAGEQRMKVKEVVSFCDFWVFLGTRALFEEIEKRYNLKVIFVDFTNPENLETAITPETKVGEREMGFKGMLNCFILAPVEFGGGVELRGAAWGTAGSTISQCAASWKTS